MNLLLGLSLDTINLRDVLVRLEIIMKTFLTPIFFLAPFISKSYSCIEYLRRNLCLIDVTTNLRKINQLKLFI